MPGMPKKSTKIVQEEEPTPIPEIYEEPVIEEVKNTFQFKVTHFYSVVTILAFATGVLLGYVVWGREK